MLNPESVVYETHVSSTVKNYDLISFGAHRRTTSRYSRPCPIRSVPPAANTNPTISVPKPVQPR